MPGMIPLGAIMHAVPSATQVISPIGNGRLSRLAVPSIANQEASGSTDRRPHQSGPRDAAYKEAGGLFGIIAAPAAQISTRSISSRLASSERRS